MENKDLQPAPEEGKRAYVYCGFSQADHNIQLPGKPLSKVPIGTAYQPRPRSSVTDEELFIQHHLLAKPRNRARNLLLAAVWVAAIVAYVTFAFTL